MAFKIAHRAALDRELMRVIRWQVAEAVRKAGSRKLSGTDRVHVARTSCKKVRAALRLIRFHEPELYARENGWFRDSARQLARFRDADVMIACLEDLGAAKSLAPSTRQFFAAEQAHIEEQRRAEHAGTGLLKSELNRFTRRMRTAARRLEGRALAGLTFKVLADGYVATYRKARRAMPSSPAAADARFHEWRKWTKMCGYQGRLLRDAWPAVMKAWTLEYAELGDVLGTEHDLSVLRQHLMDQVGPGSDLVSAAAALRVVENRRRELRRRAIALGQRLFAHKPRAAGRHLALLWKSAAVRA